MAVVRSVPAELPLLEPDNVTVIVEDTNGNPKKGVPVYIFDGPSYTGYNDISDVNGEVVFDLPEGSYRFRADMNDTQFWSGASNHCDIPGCTEVTVVVTIPVTVSVEDTNGVSKEGVPVYAFDGPNYTGYTGTTDVNGEVDLTLPQGDYRFRADYDGTQFWSGDVNHCTIPGCETATVEVTLPVVVTVLDTDAVPQVGLPVYVFDEAVYTGFNDTTDGNGEVSFTLPQGDFRFRSDLNGTQFWSDSVNNCTIPGCESASITVTIPVTVIVQSQTGSPYPDLPIYVFSGESYTGFNGISDANGQVVFTLPAGDYRFRSDYDGVQFWSDDVDHCSIPGCLEAIVEIPGGTGEVNVTIDYTYDPLYRLTEADYSTGEYFWYTYDAVGNRLTQEIHEGLNTYVYDDANRLIEVDGTAFIWDDNGNLIQDDVRVYYYDHANRLDFVSMGVDTYTYGYNGLGDRLRQTVNGVPTNYTLDINQGLTQVLASEEGMYLYGLTRIGEKQTSNWQFYLGDALGSVRQLVDVINNGIGAGNTYEPFGDELVSTGLASTVYRFAGEWTDGSNLIHLRARYYSPQQGRFIQADPWEGEHLRPSSFNSWNYGESNPINQFDPSGLCVSEDVDGTCDLSWRCSLIADEHARNACWQSFCKAPKVTAPSGFCNADCMDAYHTYLELVNQSEAQPTIRQILFMTAVKEYFNIVDRPYYNKWGFIDNPQEEGYPQPTARSTGREALARAFYHFCGGDAQSCDGTDLYRFLSGYEPWTGKAGKDHGDPKIRAMLLKEALQGSVYGTGHILNNDIDKILSAYDSSWKEGIGPDKPWQWFTTGKKFSLEPNTFGYSSNKKAILAVDTGGGLYLWMVTYRQDRLWW